ncbi:hypothetical protein KY358_04795 [Candidatus Woesearchaeota archaeon]|nr:hypothetical protein [Candidatus Woesearchaeota archaeon]
MGQEDKPEVTITYETLFALLRTEKERSELQKLDSSFFANILVYLKDKKALITRQTEGAMQPEEKRKIEEQLENVKKIIKEIYDKREKKIVALAIEKSKNTSAIIDNSAFLREEGCLFRNIMDVLMQSRKDILMNLISLKEPASPSRRAEGQKDEEKAEKSRPAEKKDTKLVRFLSSVPRFVGRQLEEYGPFDEEDIASLPMEIANVLIKKGRVEEISED